MSFKREGDDENLLKNLTGSVVGYNDHCTSENSEVKTEHTPGFIENCIKIIQIDHVRNTVIICLIQLCNAYSSVVFTVQDQRVRELLGSHIPQDEAKLLSNGRLTCTICLRRPVFDTINMLANHRRGKRHLSELSKYIKCKEDSEMRVIQRKQAYSDGSTEGSPPFKISKSATFTSITQGHLLGYKHVMAKKSGLKHQRKPILEILSVLPKKPSVLSSQDQLAKRATTTVKHYLKSISRKTSLEKVVEKNRENYGIDLQNDSNCKSVSNKNQGASTEKNSSTMEMKTSSPSIETKEYEMKLRMSGWIKDLTGKWVKDPNVEFDSDEDETPPPPP